jgi:hypothetical protein
MDDHFITFDGKIKCLHCQCVWKSLSSTTKRAHLSSREFSLQYQVAGCDESISQIDTAFKESNNEFFRELQRKKMKSRTLSVKRDRFTSFSPSAKSNVSSISSNSSFDDELEIMEEVTVKRQTNLYEYTNPQQAHNTDIAIANFFYRCGIPYECSETLAFQAMIAEIKRSPPMYKPPSEFKIRRSLLDDAYERVKKDRAEKFANAFSKGFALSLVTDGATISKRPLSNVIAVLSQVGPELITYDDATEHMQDGGKKDARYYAELLRDAVEEVGPPNVALICTDNASVMQAAWAELSPLYPWIFFVGCLAHKVNTFVKKICDIAAVYRLIQSAKVIIHQLGEVHTNCALMKKYSLYHLKSELGFIIPAETRFGLFLLMLHRLALLKPAIQATVCDASFVDDKDENVNDLVLNNSFWDEVFELIQYLMPVLRLIRFADSDDENLSLVYSTVNAVHKHLSEQVDSIPAMPGVATEIVALFQQESQSWVNDLHKMMHVLNPRFSSDYADPSLQLAIKNAVKQVYSDSVEKQVQLLREIVQFVDREGEYREPMTMAAMNTEKPSQFFRMYGLSTPLLQEIAIRLHPLVIGSSCSERNWKQYKDIRTKKRNRLTTSSVEKLVMVQTSLIVEERDIDSAVAKVKAWLDVDLIRAESQRINRAESMLAKSFKNFIEPWECEAIRTDLFGNRERLLNKYKNICFQDDEPVYTGRVVNVEWKKKNKSISAGYSLVTVDIHRVETENDGDIYESYLINEMFHEMIKDCDPEFNQSFHFITSP